LAEARDPAKVVPPQGVIKADSQDQAIRAKSASREARCHCKEGFQNRKEYKAINISTLQTLADSKKLSEINIQALSDAGLISTNDMVKVLGNGKLTSKLDVTAHAFSKSAKAAIEALKGTATII
jgi:ribosomal protein L15